MIVSLEPVDNILPIIREPSALETVTAGHRTRRGATSDVRLLTPSNTSLPLTGSNIMSPSASGISNTPLRYLPEAVFSRLEDELHLHHLVELMRVFHVSLFD